MQKLHDMQKCETNDRFWGSFCPSKLILLENLQEWASLTIHRLLNGPEKSTHEKQAAFLMIMSLKIEKNSKSWEQGSTFWVKCNILRLYKTIVLLNSKQMNNTMPKIQNQDFL
jgi:hypothetical protein